MVLNDCPRFEFPPKHTPITGLHTGGGDATIKLRSRINIVVDPLGYRYEKWKNSNSSGRYERTVRPTSEKSMLGASAG